MRFILVNYFSRMFNFFRLTFLIFVFHSFVFTYAAPVDSLMLSSEKNQDSSSTSKKSKEGTKVLADGISYRLDAWSQYDNPEEGIEREGDIHEFPESRKTTTRDQNLLWPNGVVKYWIHSSIRNESAKLAILQKAMQEVMKKTCVKFEEIFPDMNGELPPSSWVNITGNQRGCFSDLGRSRFIPSNLNLDIKSCFKTTGHAMHEILHTLGVYHEHMRPDRDDHITILWSNIKKGNEFNFGLMSNRKVTTYGLPYDYDSIMHYSMTAFSKNKSQATIVPRKQLTPIGQRDHLSVLDIKKLLITYKCNDIDPSVVKSQSKNDQNYIQHFEHKKVEMKSSLMETEEKVDNYNDDDGGFLAFFKPYENFGSWTFMDFLNYPEYSILQLFSEYFYFLV